MKTLISRVNLKEEKKNNIFKINWKNDDLNKFKQIKNNSQKNKEMIIFIKGKENYIKNINENIEKWINDKTKIIDCYDVEEVKENFGKIINKYDNMLNTMGETKIEK